MAKKKGLLDQIRRPRVVISLLLAAGVLSYGVAQIDIIPDVTPVIGYLDDVVIILGAFIAFMQFTKHFQRKRRGG